MYFCPIFTSRISILSPPVTFNLVRISSVEYEISIEEERQILINIFNNYPYLTVILISHRQDNSDLFDKVYKIKRRNVNE